MKKLLNPIYLPWFVLGTGGIGFALRIWLFTGGVDEKGFLISGHPADILIWALTIFVMVFLLIATRGLQEGGKYSFNFPASLPGSIGCGLCALGFAVTSITEFVLTADTLSRITSVLGILSAAVLGFMAYGRWKGLRTSVIYHTVICLYLIARLISQYRNWSWDPRLQDYCFQLLGTVCLMLATYHRAAFDANMGKRRPHAFFHLAAVYLCCLSLVGSENIAFYLGAGAWMLTDLCNLVPMQRRQEET